MVPKSILLLPLIIGLFDPGTSYAVNSSVEARHIYTGYYSREGNDGKMALTSGNNHYIRFYPENRIIRLYIPYPYSKKVKPGAIKLAFDAAAKKSTGSAYIRDKFGVMDEPIVAHLDFFRWVDGHIMYDCGKPKPCKVLFNGGFMTVIKSGIVLEHKIRYEHVNVP
jgi:hypothetical protein